MSGLESLNSLGNSEWAKKFPESRVITPFLSNLESVGFSGELPTDHISPTAWDFAFHLRNGMVYPLKLEVDPGRQPWELKVDLSPLELDLALMSAFIPTPWGIPQAPGTVRLEKATLSGPIGKWKDWQAKVQATAESPQVELSMINRTLTGVKLDLDFLATGSLWKGTSKIEVDRVATDVVKGGFQGFRSPQLDFTYSTVDGSAEFSGPWTAQDIYGSPYTGSFALSSKEGYRVDAETSNLNWSELPYQLDGNWKAKIRLEDKSFQGFDPDFEISLEGTEFQIGEMDLSSRPISLKFDGNVSREGTQITFDQVGIRWGESLELDLFQTEWDGNRLHAREASLSGDLKILSGLVPGFRIDPRIERFIHPQGWKIQGGILIQTDPFLLIEVQQGQIETGKGIKGPDWLQVFPRGSHLVFSGADPAARPDRTRKGSESSPSRDQRGDEAQARFSGRIPRSGETSQVWITRAVFDGTLLNCNGRFDRLRPDGKLDQHLFGWAGANGRISLDWNSASRRVESTLQMDDFIWYSRPGVTDRPFRQTLRSGGARLSVSAEQDGESRYEIKKLLMAWGKQNPVEMGISGSVMRSGGAWTPDLDLRIQGNRSPETAVFRGVILKGSGVFLGKIRGNARGNWVLDGKASLDDLSFEHIVAPVILSGARGTLK